MPKLAIAGGTPVVTQAIAPYNSIGAGEIAYVNEVLQSGCLSGYVGAWCEAFEGGPQVRAFETAWSKQFAVEHAIAVNSATSGLFAAIGAAGVGPGDEVIVPPYTMSATAMAPLVYGGIPVFADIEPETFCIDPAAVQKLITPKTKAIMAVNLFGHPARLQELRRLADKHGIYLIEDNAQGPLAMEGGKYAGTIGHIGVFSLNFHKHIHTGEGGMCVTADDTLALKLKMIRNHGENAVVPSGLNDLTNMIGFNYRMTELSAAVGRAQLERASEHVAPRVKLAEQLTSGVTGIVGLTPPVVRNDCRHVYYVWAMKYNQEVFGVSRRTFSQALQAEGFPNYEGYVKPLYMLPVFQQRTAIGKSGFPFNLSERTYEAGLCPVVERMHESELLWFPNCMHQPGEQLGAQLVEAVQKVAAEKAQLQEFEAKSKGELANAAHHR